MSPCGTASTTGRISKRSSAPRAANPSRLLGHRPCLQLLPQDIDPEKVDRNTIKSNVQFVCIDLTEGEDEQQIFDTINSLGVRLTTAELLKNYFFNRENEQAFKECWEDVFEPTAEKREYWEQEIVTGRIKRTLVDLFFDAFLQILVQDKRRGVTTEDKLFYSRTSNLFQSYKDFIAKYCDGSKDEVLGAMKAYAEVFESTFDPTCCDRNVSSAPSAERMNVLIFGLKNSTLIPYVLYVRKNVESSDEQAKIFATLESYIVRRMLVRATTKNYNRLFTSLILNEAKDAAAREDRACRRRGGDHLYAERPRGARRVRRVVACTTSSPKASSICWKAPSDRA